MESDERKSSGTGRAVAEAVRLRDEGEEKAAEGELELVTLATLVTESRLL